MDPEKGQRLLKVTGAALIPLLIVLYLVTIHPHMVLETDNGLYQVLARSFGRDPSSWMRLVNIPSEPVDDLHPFLFPLLLAPIVKCSRNLEAEVIASKVLVSGMGLLAIFFFWLIIRERLRGVPLIAVILLSAISPHFLSMSHQVLSDVPYLMFSMFALFLFSRYYRAEKVASPLGVIFLIVLAASFYIRWAGVILMASVALWLLFEKRVSHRRAKATWVLGTSVIACSLFFLLNLIRGGSAGNIKVFFLKDYLSPERGTIGLTGFILRLGQHIVLHMKTFSRFIVGSDLLGASLAFLVIALVVFIGFAAALRKKRGILEYYFALYILAMTAWIDPHYRYLIPVLPLLIYYFFEGCLVLGSLACLLATSKTLRPLLCGAIVATALTLLLHRSSEGVILGRYSPRYLAFLIAAFIYVSFLVRVVFAKRERLTLALVSGVFAALLFTNAVLAMDWAKRREPRTIFSEAEMEYYRASMRLREGGNGPLSEEPPYAVMCCQSFLTFLWSGRRTVLIPPAGESQVLHKIASEGVQLVIIDRIQVRGLAKRRLEPLVKMHPELFIEEFSIGGTGVYRVRPKLLEKSGEVDTKVRAE